MQVYLQEVLRDYFTYLDSNVSSTESDVDIRLVKVRTAIDRISIIWKSDQSNKIFSKQRLCQFYYMNAPHDY